MSEIDDRRLALLIRGEFLGIPALRVTAQQVQAWWDVDAARCDRLLAALVDEHFLQRSANDGYIRARHR
jgi:hypothetical protein